MPMSADKEGGLCTEHPALDRSSVRRKLRSAIENLPSLAAKAALNEAISGAFLDGSNAAADAAIAELESVSAEYFADNLSTLAAVVSKGNAHPFAALVARIAFAEIPGDIDAAAPLLACAFASPDVQAAAVQAFLDESQLTTTRSDRDVFPETESSIARSCFSDVLSRSVPFLGQILRDSQPSSNAYVLTRGLCRLAKLNGGSISEHICEVLIEVGLVRSMSNGAVANMDAVFVQFLATELGSLLTNRHLGLSLARSCLILALETNDASCLVVLWKCARSRIQDAFSDIGEANVLFILSCTLSAAACSGNIWLARNVLGFVSAWISSKEKSGQALECDDVVAAVVDVAAIAVGTLATAGAKGDTISRLAVQLRRYVRTNRAAVDDGSTDMGLCCLLEEAAFCQCARAALSLGLLRNVRERWHQSRQSKASLSQWISTELLLVLENITLETSHRDTEDHAQQSMSSFSSMHRGESERSTRTSVDENALAAGTQILKSWKMHLLPHTCAFICCVCLQHRDSETRQAAVSAISSIKSCSVIFYFLPVLLIAISNEGNGVVAADILIKGLASSHMLHDKQTARRMIASILSLMSVGPFGSPDACVTEACITALAAAARLSPSVALPSLLGQIEIIYQSFGTARASVKVAAMAAAVLVIRDRPARGSAFIPLIQKCITTESMQSNPEAASLGFAAMHDMAFHDVLDSAKALRIVFKSFDNPADIPRPARRSYLGLLGSASGAARSRKGRTIAAKAVAVLRQAVLNQGPHVSKEASCLRWDEVDQAAAALCEFDVNDVLRMDLELTPAEENYDEEEKRMAAIEEHVMSFVGELISLSGYAVIDGKKGAANCENPIPHVVRLLQRIAVEEWAKRPRGKFDPDRLERLRAASEALRRARRAGQADESSAGAGEVVAQDFSRAVDNLPTGAIKSLSRCSAWCLLRRDGKSETQAKVYAATAAIVALCEAKALSPALPWARLVRCVVLSSSSTTECKIAAMSVGFSLPRDSYAVASLHREVFASTSEVFTPMTKSLPPKAACALARLYVEAGDVDEFVSMLAFIQHEDILRVLKASIDGLGRLGDSSKESDGSDVTRVVQAILRKVGEEASRIDDAHPGLDDRHDRSLSEEGELESVIQHLGQCLKTLWPEERAIAVLLRSESVDGRTEDAGEEVDDGDVLQAAALVYTGATGAIMAVIRALMRWREWKEEVGTSRHRRRGDGDATRLDSGELGGVRGDCTADRLLECALAGSVPRLPPATRCALVVALSEWWSAAAGGAARPGRRRDGGASGGPPPPAAAAAALWAASLAVRAGGASALLPRRPDADACVFALAATPATLAAGEAAGPAAAIRRALARRCGGRARGGRR